MEKRLDIFLVDEKYVKSRTLAQSLIDDGKITLNGQICFKASTKIKDNDSVKLIGELPKYVGRGGLKLEKAIDCFSISLSECICLDIGASTGGFTDCMLQNGAKKIYAVDVGKGQLDEKLKSDKRVTSLESLDIRNVYDEITENVDFISIDVSFVSLKLILPEAKRFIKQGKTLVALIKPQFEAGKKYLGKHGVIKDKKLQQQIVNEISDFAESINYKVISIIESPISGGDGNIEFLMYLKF